MTGARLVLSVPGPVADMARVSAGTEAGPELAGACVNALVAGLASQAAIDASKAPPDVRDALSTLAITTGLHPVALAVVLASSCASAELQPFASLAHLERAVLVSGLVRLMVAGGAS